MFDCLWGLCPVFLTMEHQNSSSETYVHMPIVNNIPAEGGGSSHHHQAKR